MKQINIDSLNAHLFEAIEMLKNNSDSQASPQEKMDIETAKAIADLGKVAIEGFKVKAQVLSILSKSENPDSTKHQSLTSGILTEENQ